MTGTRLNGSVWKRCCGSRLNNTHLFHHPHIPLVGIDHLACIGKIEPLIFSSQVCKVPAANGLIGWVGQHDTSDHEVAVFPERSMIVMTHEMIGLRGKWLGGKFRWRHCCKIRFIPAYFPGISSFGISLFRWFMMREAVSPWIRTDTSMVNATMDHSSSSYPKSTSLSAKDK